MISLAQAMEIKEEALQEFVEEWKVRIDKSTWSSKNCVRYSPMTYNMTHWNPIKQNILKLLSTGIS